MKILQLYETPGKSPLMLAEVAVGSSMRDRGTGMPASCGTHVRLYPVMRVVPILGGVHKKRNCVPYFDTLPLKSCTR